MSDYLLFGPAISLILGLLIGSFINCLAWRLYKEETIFGRSYCPKCLHKIKWYDNIPLASFLALKGKCRHCLKTISWQYPLVEFVVGLLFYASFYFFSLEPLLVVRSFLIVSILVLVFIFDFRWYLIPVSALLWGGGAVIILGALTYPLNIGSYIFALLVTVVVAVLFFGTQYLITKGNGLGEGDIWLGAFLGAVFVNISDLIVAVLSAYCLGAVIGIILLVLGHKKWGSKLPLGVFLSIGAIISLFWGGQIAAWYLGLFSL